MYCQQNKLLWRLFIVMEQIISTLYCIYIHIFPNDKTYIGKAKGNPEHRWGKNGKGYMYKNKKTGKYHSPKMANAILKYGWENIKHEILEINLTAEEACDKEKEYIKQYNSFGFNGYNMTLGGEGSEGHRGLYGPDNPNYGRHTSALTEEGRKKMSERMSGEGNPQYGKTGELSPNWGKKGPLSPNWKGGPKPKVTQEEKHQHMSDAYTGRDRTGKNNPKARRVRNKNTGLEFDTLKEAGEWAGVGKSNIGSACRGYYFSKGIKYNYTYSGHVPSTGEPAEWEYC